MKKVFIALSLMAISTGIMAAGNATESSSAKALDNSIREQVVFPHFLMEEIGLHMAEMHFKVNADGSINVREIETDEPELKNNLFRQAKEIHVNTAGLDLSDTYKIVFRFNTLDGN